MESFVPGILAFVRDSCKEGTPSSDAQLLNGLFKLLEGAFMPERGFVAGKEASLPAVRSWFALPAPT